MPESRHIKGNIRKACNNTHAYYDVFDAMKWNSSLRSPVLPLDLARFVINVLKHIQALCFLSPWYLFVDMCDLKPDKQKNAFNSLVAQYAICASVCISGGVPP